MIFDSHLSILTNFGQKVQIQRKKIRGDSLMHQKPCPDMISGQSNIVKFCKKQGATPNFTQFEIVRAIYDSGILAQNSLSPATKLVLIAIAHHFNPKKADMFPSQRFIAKQLGISERSAERAVAELKKADLITYETIKVNHYKFTAKFFESVKLSDKFRQIVGTDARQIVGQTNKHEQKNNNFQKSSFYSNQPKGIEYQDLETPSHQRDDRTPENDFQTAQKFVQELLPMKHNPLIKAKLDKIFEIWGAENLTIEADKKIEPNNHYLLF